MGKEEARDQALGRLYTAVLRSGGAKRRDRFATALVEHLDALASPAAARTDEAEDLRQEAILRVFRALDSRAEIDDFPRWLGGVVRHCSADRIRDRRQRRLALFRVVDAGEGDGDAGSSMEEECVDAEDALVTLVRKAHLNEGQAAMMRALVVGKRAPEIARETGRSSGAVRMEILRIRRKMGRFVGSIGLQARG